MDVGAAREAARPAPGRYAVGMTSALSVLVTEGAAAHRELPMPPFMFLLVTLALFGAGLGALWSFRGTAAKVRGGAPRHHGNGSVGADGTTGGHH